MPQQLIIQQIDVMVVGPKKYQFIALVLQKQFQYQQESQNSKKQDHNSYINILKNFFRLSNSQPLTMNKVDRIKSMSQMASSKKSPVKVEESCQRSQTQGKGCQQLIWQQQNSLQNSLQSQRSSLQQQSSAPPSNLPLGLGGLHKLSKTIQTQSFWLTINFYTTDLKIYDPLLSQYTRGNVMIGIVVSDDQGVDIDNIKIYLNQANANPLNDVTKDIRNNRAESLLQSKIHARIHIPQINGFTSLLCLRLRDACRLVQETNNLRLTNNQIFRWVVDRFFENKYRIKLKENLGDQIQRGSIKKLQQKQYPCAIM